MQVVRLWLLLVLVYLVDSKNNVKALTDSMGQEIIEIGTPIKELQELPQGLEEEPSVETDEETTSKAPQPATRRETKQAVTTTAAKPEEADKEESISQEDEEVRIEKELAEIYKDTDYKSDNSDTKKALKMETNVTDDKPIGRARANFQFQPNVNNREDIERFRTSVDEINCEKRVTQRLKAEVSNSSTSEALLSFMQMGLIVLSLIVCY